MALKRKDGSVYKLRSPNKLMKRQDLWINDEILTIHNFDQLSPITLEIDEVAVNPPSPEPEFSETESANNETTPNDIPEYYQPPVDMSISPVAIDKSIPQELESKEILQPENRSQFRESQRLTMYCLPVITISSKDDLYEEEVVAAKYGNPFKFQASIVNNTDFRILYWTTVTQVTETSIIFHPERKRWWSVQSINSDPSGDGFILTCIPSRLKPSFASPNP